MDKAIEAAARALSPHLRFYGDGHGHAVTIAGKTIKAFLAALEAAGVRLVYPSEARAQLIDGDERTTVRIFTPYAPTSPGEITGIRKAEVPCSDCIDGWCQMNCGPRVG